MADVKVPGLGPVNKKALIIGGLVAAGALGYIWIRHRNASASSAASSTGGASTSTGIDPQTGYPYGSPEDTSALAQLDGTSAGYGVGDQLDQIDPSTGETYGEELQQLDSGSAVGDTTATTTTAGTTVTTNAEWDAAAISALEDAGYSSADISTASAGLGRYLAKLPLNGRQATLVQIAVGLVGPPPVGGPYAITPAASSPGSGGGSGKAKDYRQVADGRQSLAQVAAARHTSAAHIIATTEAPGSGIDAKNRAAFLAYVAKGTNHPMPAGLVYYTSNP